MATAIKRALVSVSDKTGLVEFVKTLTGYGVDILSTGGTARKLREGGIDVTDVSEYTGFPEMMDGRVKTLHPKVHGALLGLRDNEEHVAAMREHGIEPIDMVVVNLYPFESTVARPDVELADAIENIDIGGPSMVRSAAKNYRFVTIVPDARFYDEVLASMEQNGGAVDDDLRQRLALEAFRRTAQYDTAISDYLGKVVGGE
jgi:phosphoribosylaminoimidazolecarboxamide formyltransferase/IMP cyclohydrolase